MWWEDIYIPTYFTIAAILAGVVKLRRLSTISKLVLVILILNLVADLYTTYLSYHSVNTLFYNSLHTGVEQLFILWIYYSTKIYNKQKRLLLYTIIIGGLLAIYNIFFWQGPKQFTTYTFIPFGLLIAFLSYINIRYFIISNIAVLSNIIFWFSIANFVYFIVIVPIMSFLPLAIEISLDLAKTLKMYTNNIAYGVWSVLIAIGFICQRKKTI